MQDPARRKAKRTAGRSRGKSAISMADLSSVKFAGGRTGRRALAAGEACPWLRERKAGRGEGRRPPGRPGRAGASRGLATLLAPAARISPSKPGAPPRHSWVASPNPARRQCGPGGEGGPHRASNAPVAGAFKPARAICGPWKTQAFGVSGGGGGVRSCQWPLVQTGRGGPPPPSAIIRPVPRGRAQALGPMGSPQRQDEESGARARATARAAPNQTSSPSIPSPPSRQVAPPSSGVVRTSSEVWGADADLHDEHVRREKEKTLGWRSTLFLGFASVGAQQTRVPSRHPLSPTHPRSGKTEIAPRLPSAPRPPRPQKPRTNAAAGGVMGLSWPRAQPLEGWLTCTGLSPPPPPSLCPTCRRNLWRYRHQVRASPARPCARPVVVRLRLTPTTTTTTSSPLYVYSSTFAQQPTMNDIEGVTSIIFWMLTIFPLFKYVMVVLSADHDGEGGGSKPLLLLLDYLIK